MWSLFVVAPDPFIDIGLQLLNGIIELLAKRDLIKLLKHRLVKPFADAVCLRASRLGFGVIDILLRGADSEPVMGAFVMPP